MSSTLAPHISPTLRGKWEPVYRSRLHYLVTWSTRGRKAVLREKHADAIRRRLASICRDRTIELCDAATGSDHVHVLFSLPPSHSAASAVREMKGRLGLELLSDHPELRVWLGGNLAWDEHYAIETVSHARLERVRTVLRARHAGTEGSLARAS
jgi:putative transposase